VSVIELRLALVVEYSLQQGRIIFASKAAAGGAPMTSTVPAPQIDPRSFAEALTTTVLPAILNGEHSETISAVWGERLGHLAR